MKILISGFEPFGGLKHNPSEELIHSLPSSYEGHLLRGVVLPVSFERAFGVLKAEMDEWQPQVVFSLGLAMKRTEITPEKIAVNWINASLADNEGLQPRHQKIVEAGRDGIFSRLPVEAFVEKLKSAEIPASLSLSAGSYVCNQVMYLLLQEAEQRHLPAGFVHVPAGLENKVLLKALFLMIEGLL
jgi:pyroglutamyl-peptidase